MQQEGVVSLWVGTVESEKLFQAYLRVYFSEDGDFLGSPFSRAFGIGYYEEGRKESAYYASLSDSIGHLLDGASSADVIVPRFQSLGPIGRNGNAVVLLYNYLHLGPRESSDGGVSMVFVGSVSYR